MSLTLAIDAMGGDLAPQSSVEGMCLAAYLHKNVAFQVFGNENYIQDFIPKSLLQRIEIIHTDEVISSHTSPREALRGLKRSSMRMAIQAVAEGRAHSVVSSGNTGAYMALSKVILKMLPGIDRPAIARSLPNLKGESIFLDLGANIEVSALNLAEFAVMGQAFAKCILHIDRPSIGILNVGSEDLKGNVVVRQAQELLRTHAIVDNFYGFVEGNDIFAGTTDVIVTDGFSGNIALKTAEGCAHFLSTILKQTFQSSWRSKLSAFLAKKVLKDMKKRFDPGVYNGAPFLGLRGIAVKSHGGANASSFAHAVGVAIELAKTQVNEKISSGIAVMKQHISVDSISSTVSKTPL